VTGFRDADEKREGNTLPGEPKQSSGGAQFAALSAGATRHGRLSFFPAGAVNPLRLGLGPSRAVTVGAAHDSPSGPNREKGHRYWTAEPPRPPNLLSRGRRGPDPADSEWL